jgi:hypothetical protein
MCFDPRPPHITTNLTPIPLTPAGQDILVPLTQSLYVPGKISDVGRVLIDVGTGYYVEKSLPKAKEYLEKRVGGQAVLHRGGGVLMGVGRACGNGRGEWGEAKRGGS